MYEIDIPFKTGEKDSGVMQGIGEKLIKLSIKNRKPVDAFVAGQDSTSPSPATDHAKQNGGKPWKYLLIPHDQIQDQMTLAGLVARFERKNAN